MTYRLRLDGQRFFSRTVPQFAALLVGMAAASYVSASDNPPIAAVSAVSAPANPASDRYSPFVRIVERARQSAVNIHTEKRQKSLDIVFSAGKGAKVNGMGSGIIVDERGYILTNYHVVHEVESLRVTLHNDTSYDARVIDYDNRRDLAVIKINAPHPLPVAPLGTSADLMLAEEVIAIGNAYGYEGTVSRGIISALNRDVEVNDEQSYDHLIQTDTAINPGNSGGPLINCLGEVIGINVAIRAGAQKIGFAIPIDDARKVLARLLSVELRDNHFHGVLATDYKKTSADRRLVVTQVLPNSPAAKCGIVAGDVIRKSGAIDITDLADFERSLLEHRVGEQVPLMVLRDKDIENLTLELGKAPTERIRPGRQTLPNLNAQSGNGAKQAPPAPSLASNSNVPVVPTAGRAWDTVGVRLRAVAENDTRLTSIREKPYHGGMEVAEVRGNSTAVANGIQVGDILVGLHTYETITQDNVEYVLNSPQIRNSRQVKFYIVRKGETLFGNFALK